MNNCDNRTVFLRNAAEAAVNCDNDIETELRKAMNSFRTFPEALDEFLLENGFIGDINNSGEKTQFIADHFDNQTITKPRSLGKWFSMDSIGRETAFQLCFAFQLTLEKVNDVLKKLCMYSSASESGKNIDCHNRREAVYYYCLKKRLDYNTAERIISRLSSSVKSPAEDDEILYTSAVIDELNQLDDENMLIDYLNVNASLFERRNSTAIRIIRELWNKIKCKGGYIESEYNLRKQDIAKKDENKEGKEEREDRLATERFYLESLVEITKTDSKGATKQKPNLLSNNISDSEAMLWIWGISGDQLKRNGADRSLIPFFVNNDLINKIASTCFPTQASLAQVLGDNAAKCSYLSLRKDLLLLHFYVFWIREQLSKKNFAMYKEEADLQRYIDDANTVLDEAGMSELYYGNPYDWLFLSAAYDPCDPLETFRFLLNQIVLEKEDDDWVD